MQANDAICFLFSCERRCNMTTIDKAALHILDAAAGSSLLSAAQLPLAGEA